MGDDEPGDPFDSVDTHRASGGRDASASASASPSPSVSVSASEHGPVEALPAELVSESDIVDAAPSLSELPSDEPSSGDLSDVRSVRLGCTSTSTASSASLGDALSVDVLFEDEPSVPSVSRVASIARIPPVARFAPPIFPASTSVFPPAIALAAASSGPVPTEDMFADDDPTVRLGALPPAPFPRHLAPGSVAAQLARGPLEMSGSAASSSLAPVAIEGRSERESRGAPTMRIRGSEEGASIVVLRGRPTFLWGAALLAAGALAGIVCSVVLVRSSDEAFVDLAPSHAPSTAAQAAFATASPSRVPSPSPRATASPEASAIAVSAAAHVEPTRSTSVESAPLAKSHFPAPSAKTAFAPTSPAVPVAAVPAVVAPKALAPAAIVKTWSSAAPSLAKKPAPIAAPAPVVTPTVAVAATVAGVPASASASPAASTKIAGAPKKSATSIESSELANDQAADALARAQLKAALR